MKTRLVYGLIALMLACGGSTIARADIIQVDLLGNAGMGLLPGNENPPTSGGSGGEVGPGIFFDTVTLQLTINIAWGSGNGFTNLTGDASAGHIHGPTADPAPISFSENAPVLIGLSSLPGWNPSAINGGFSGIVTLDSTQATWLQEGRLYINVHTVQNPGGEIRGYLIVPEPGALALIGLGGLGLLFASRRIPRN
jgi:hypothetical protein